MLDMLTPEEGDEEMIPQLRRSVGRKTAIVAMLHESQAQNAQARISIICTSFIIRDKKQDLDPAAFFLGRWI